MDVFRHHLYEYWKGLRNLILHTAPKELVPDMVALLERHKVPYLVCPLSKGHSNLFFGDQECLDVICTFGVKRLCDYTEEQDFILGIMLGYDRRVQCKRYLERKSMAELSTAKSQAL